MASPTKLKREARTLKCKAVALLRTRHRCQAARSTLVSAALSPSCASEMISLTPRGPCRARECRKSSQKVFASEAPTASV